MTPDRQKQLADTFRRAHRGPLLLLPNAWDAMSARQFEAAGFGAVATTSGGLAWDLGYADGEKAPWREVVAAHERIVRAVRVPVTADIEAGYGDTPAQVAKSIAEILRHRRRRFQSGGRHVPPRHAGPADRGRRRAHPRRARGSERGRRSGCHQRPGRSLPQERRRAGQPLRRDRAARQGLSRRRRRLHLSVRPGRPGHHRPPGEGARQRTGQHRRARRYAAGRRFRDASALRASASPQAPRSR